MGGRFAAAPNLERLWSNIEQAVDGSAAVAGERWLLDPSDVIDTKLGLADHAVSTRACLIEPFAPPNLKLFGRRLADLDPMVHLAIDASLSAWRDASTHARVPKAQRVGVVFGNIVLPTEAVSALTRSWFLEQARAAGVPTPPGAEPGPVEPLNAFVAGLPAALVAEALGVSGPAFTLDAACASSLYAVKIACDWLRDGVVDAVVAGGVSRPDSLYTQMGFSQLRALSARGRPAPFDAAGDGLVVGEGAGFFVLKRLEDAELDEDRILAVIQGIGWCNDLDGALLAPSSEGQLRAMHAAYEQAGWSPQSVELIECHAPGTPAGDTVELTSLRRLWGESGWRPGQCVIGSVKSNVGHALTAAGAAGLLKVLMSLGQRVRPPTANFQSLAPSARQDFERGPFRLLQRAETWVRRSDSTPLRAAISGFGFGGINAHALIEEYRPAATSSRSRAFVDRAPKTSAIAVVAVSGQLGSHSEPQRLARYLLGVEPLETDAGASGSLEGRELGLPLGRFRIPPKELEEMLPQQSLLLKVMADATDQMNWPRSPQPRAGVFVGIAFDLNATNYQVRWWMIELARQWNRELELQLSDETLTDYTSKLRSRVYPPLSANGTMGALGGLIASRVARELRLGGPSFTVSSEETSGVHALELAVRALQHEELDCALVGAVDLASDPRWFQVRTALGDHAPPADAAFGLVLKREQDALRDGDSIIARITSVSADRVTSEAATNHLSDHQALTAVEPGYLELGPSGTRSHWIGGKPGAASGLGLIVQALLAIKYRVVPDRTGRSTQYWLNDGNNGPRQATAVARGLGGQRVIVRMVEPRQATRVVSPATPRSFRATIPIPLPLTGTTREGLEQSIQHLGELRDRLRDQPLDCLGQSWWQRHRTQGRRPVSAVLIARDADELEKLLEEARAGLRGGNWPPPAASQPGSRLIVASRPKMAELGRDGEVVFVYPGLGNAVAGMGKELSRVWPWAFDPSDHESQAAKTQIDPGDCWASGESPSFLDNRGPIMSQVAFGVVLTDLLAGFGLRPRSVLGYSLGESAAFFAMRAWRERDEMHRRIDRSPLFQTLLTGPCLAARSYWNLKESERVDWLTAIVSAPVEQVESALIAGGNDQAFLLAINTPLEVVLGGRRSAVERVARSISAPLVPLPLVSTVHCPVARQVESQYRELHELPVTPPSGIRFYSGAVGGELALSESSCAAAITDQALVPVNFPRLVRKVHESRGRVFIELGPGNSCSRMIREILKDQPHIALSAHGPVANEPDQIIDLLARLLVHGVDVDLGPCFTEPKSASSTHSDLETSRKTPSEPQLSIPIRHLACDLPPPPGHSSWPRVSRRASDPVRASVPEPAPSHVDKALAQPIAAVNGTTPMSQAIPSHPVPPTTMEPMNPRPEELRQPLAIASQMGETLETLRHGWLEGMNATSAAHEAFLQVQQELQATYVEEFSRRNALTSLWSGSIGGLTEQPLEIETETRSATATETDRKESHPTTASDAGREDWRRPESPPKALSRDACLEFARGRIGEVLGPAFARIDDYPTRVRLPDEPLMLVDRIVDIEAEPLSMDRGRLVTEHDVLPGGWYLDCERIPTSIAIESGQADLFLAGYLGIDFITEGRAVYRLLDAAVTFHRGLPTAGEVIQYDIHIDRFFRQGATHLFRFRFEGTVNGEPLLSMRDGCAGFFTEEELASGKGIVLRRMDLQSRPGKRPDDWRDLAPMRSESLTEAQLDALRRGDLVAAFGPDFAGLNLKAPAKLPGGRMNLVHRVKSLEPGGGRHGLGRIEGEADIHPGDWFMVCHFVDDRVMPGTLMYECCLHTLRIYLSRMGWIGEEGRVAYEPVPGVASRLRCRGQVVESTRLVTYEVILKELGYRPEPYALADAYMYADGRLIVEMTDMSLRITGLNRSEVESLWAGRTTALAAPDRSTAERAATRAPAAARSSEFFSRARLIEFALGQPSIAFGSRYQAFDHERFLARLPNPPYLFLERVVGTTAEPWVMKAGVEAVTEAEVLPDSWYFDADRQPTMPFAVLLEIALQSCGWLAAYMGSALTSPDDLHFRNLGGRATQFETVDRRSQTLKSWVKATRVGRAGGMIIQHYDFKVTEGDRLVYSGDTYFGFFTREALANQLGIKDVAIPLVNENGGFALNATPFPRVAPFPDERWRMIDRITAYHPKGGERGLGAIQGEFDVDPSAWFFQAHFHQDPVCPGSLGLESLVQLLKFVALKRWGPAPKAAFESLRLGRSHEWVYRGQIVPSNQKVVVDAWITELDDEGRGLTADGVLSVDGKIIYQMTGFSLRCAVDH